MEESTMLHRQVHPSFVQENKISVQVFEQNIVPETQITSSVFVPTPKDDNKLSVYNGNKYTPEESFTHFTKNFQSAGVVSVMVEECKSINLNCVEDNDPYDGHSYIDFETLKKNQIKVKAQQLKGMAIKRDWTYKK